jgi:hypothetical protein
LKKWGGWFFMPPPAVAVDGETLRLSIPALDGGVLWLRRK